MCLARSEVTVASWVGALYGWVRCHLRELDRMTGVAKASSHGACQCPQAGLQGAAEKGSKCLVQNNIWAQCSVNHGRLGVVCLPLAPATL